MISLDNLLEKEQNPVLNLFGMSLVQKAVVLYESGPNRESILILKLFLLLMGWIEEWL